MCKTHQMEKKMQVRKGAEDNSKSGVSKGKEWEKTEDRRQNGKRASKKFGCNTTHSHAKKLRLSMSKALPPLCWLMKWTSETQFRLHAWPLHKLWLVYLCHHSHFPRSLRMTAEPSHRMCYLCMTNLIFNNGKIQIRGCLSGCPVVFSFLGNTLCGATAHIAGKRKRLQFSSIICMCSIQWHPEHRHRLNTGMKVTNGQKCEISPCGAFLFSGTWRRGKGWEGQQTTSTQTKSQSARAWVLAETGFGMSCWRADGNSTASLSTEVGTRKWFASLWGSSCLPKL